jgi:N6-adenosine-specific RNA methylase IME4
MPKGLVPTPAGGSLELFDERPIEMHGFRFRTRSAVPIGRPKPEQWTHALLFTMAVEDSAAYWVGDLLRYAESRADYQQMMDQALDATGLSRHTLLNYTSICNRVEEPERRIAPSVKHADAVAALPRPEQTKWLTAAKQDGWTERELRVNIRAAKRTGVIEGQARLEGLYRVIMADPPWRYSDSGPTRDGSLGKAERRYSTMTIEDIGKLPVEEHATPRAVLFLWAPAPILLQNPGPRDVIEAWGFTYKTGMVWDKVLGNYGHYVHGVHEHLLICTRGSCLPDRPTPSPKSILVERRGEEHSGKPAGMRKIIEQLYDGPYLELFGREPVDGWDVFGNDARLWGQEQETVV